MRTAPPIAEASRASHRPPSSITALGTLLTLLVVGAVQGGVAMVTNPVDPLGMSVDFLEDAPVDDYFWPGMFLIGIALASAVTAVGFFVRWDWAWASSIENAVGYRWPWIGAMSVGAILLVFELVELFMVPFHPVMHPLLIAGSLAIVILSMTPSAKGHLKSR
jgi:hypothetical protein